MDTYELSIINRGVMYFPSVAEPIVFEDIMEGVPSKLTFTVIKGNVIDFQEGNPVRFKYKGKEVFYGFVFTKRRTREHHIEVTAYDQIRYLKNTDTRKFEDKSATDIIREIATINPSLNIGKLEDTKHKISSLTADNQSYLDIIKMALDETAMVTGKKYVLYDDFGELNLRDISTMRVEELIIDENNMEDFEYETTIDSDVYNYVQMIHEDSKTGARKRWVAKDTDSINMWGLLMKTETVQDNVNAQLKADTILKLHNRKKRTLSLKGVKGNLDVRAGFRVMVMLNVGDIILQNYLIVETVKHTFEESKHSMDIEVIGGGFSV